MNGSRRYGLRLGAIVALQGGLLAGGVSMSFLGAACGDESTSGTRVTVVSRVRATPDEGEENTFGYQVTISEAYVSVGSIFYVEGEPLVRATPRAAPWWEAFAVPSAHAHPGHFDEGAVIGEMTTATSVNLTGGTSALGVGPGVAGTALSARMEYAVPPTGPFAAELGGAVIVVAGVAETAGERAAFRATLGPDDVRNTEGAVAVEQIPVDGGDVTSDGAMTLTIDLAVWMADVDFSGLTFTTDEDGGAEQTIDDGSRAKNGLIRGVRKASAYRVSFEPSAG